MADLIPRWIRQTLSAAKSRAKKYGRDFDLTPEDIQEMFREQQGQCYWFHVPLLLIEDRRHLLLPSLDRVNSNKGYTRDNVVLACLAANLAKRDTEMDAWEEFLEYLRAAV